MKLQPNIFAEQGKKGNKVGMYNMGLCYENGWGLEKNNQKALEWYKKSAEGAYKPACCQLGRFYENGIGVLPSATEAVKWYQQAAKEGYLQLGYCYQYGYGVPRNEDKTREYFQEALDAGDKEAQSALERMSLWEDNLH